MPQIPEGKKIFSTLGASILSSDDTDVGSLAPCSHEEADLRMMIHVSDASLNSHRRIKIRTNDTDVLVLAISIASLLPIDELWVSIGSSKNLTYLPAHTIAASLGRDKAHVLPIFHSLTGCDTTSFFGGRGKKTAWDVWNVFPELTAILKELMELPEHTSDGCMETIERFTVLLYDRTSRVTKVNEVREKLFKKKARTLENIPPTKASLLQHVKRAVFQGGYIWGQTLLKQPTLPPPSRWGWQLENDRWVSYWMTLPQVKDTCYEPIHCGCKVGCRGRCKYRGANLACTRLCYCGGHCG